MLAQQGYRGATMLTPVPTSAAPEIAFSARHQRLAHPGPDRPPVVADQVLGVRIATRRDEHPAEVRGTQDAVHDLSLDHRMCRAEHVAANVVDPQHAGIGEVRIVYHELAPLQGADRAVRGL